jgi:hypothetical protein
VHALCSHMSVLDFRTEPPFNCADNDSGDITFVWVTKFIGGRDAIEEFLACGVYPMAASASRRDPSLEVENASAQVSGRS